MGIPYMGIPCIAYMASIRMSINLQAASFAASGLIEMSHRHTARKQGREEPETERGVRERETESKLHEAEAGVLSCYPRHPCVIRHESCHESYVTSHVRH